MAALPQWYFASIGSMKRVQPYCRLAIITRQMMPRTSWPHRVHLGVATRDAKAFDEIEISTPTQMRLTASFYADVWRDAPLSRALQPSDAARKFRERSPCPRQVASSAGGDQLGLLVVYRKGELSNGTIDREWPHQVALPAHRCGGANYVISLFCE